MVVYKLTDIYGWTRYGEYNAVFWSKGAVRETSGEGGLCGPGFTHAYEHPLLAILHNPMHGCYYPYRMWKCEASGRIVREGYLKLGCTHLEVLCEIKPPRVSEELFYAYAVLLTARTGSEHFQNSAWKWLTEGQDKRCFNFDNNLSHVEELCVQGLYVERPLQVACDVAIHTDDHLNVARQAWRIRK